MRTTADGVLAPRRSRLHVGDAALDLWVFDLGLACCALESLAASAGAGLDDVVGRLGAVPTTGDPADADVLLVTGTVTTKLAPAVQALHARLRPGAKVVSVGACANTGGPYWDSYSVVPGVHALLPVDLHVPGCPPRPEALLAALRDLVAA
ncbi:MAG TPA: NADH-quinone oxidoreductase subunit NuoB [Mycobacteriales bacterium]|nr:NADH-quinone oxidoreductase subunit NuoB [Mycobacteriales bacterium]